MTFDPPRLPLPLETETTDALRPVSSSEVAALRALPRTAEVHREALAGLDVLHQVETAGQPSTDALPARFRVAAWNMERCLDPEGAAALLAAERPDIVLLSEMDNGMARSGQRHTPRAMALPLGMGYAYAVEFLELTLGSSREVALAGLTVESVNDKGFHGNAILSRAPLTRVALLRLDVDGLWFGGRPVGKEPGQDRVGGRVAVLAEVPTDGGPVVVVSAHLESQADAPLREAQMLHILDAAAAFAAEGTPILVGGDLNTGNHLPGSDWRLETLFAAAERAGFHWDGNAEGLTVRDSRISLVGSRQSHLDWFCARGLSAADPRILQGLDPRGVPLSDHEPIIADWVVG